MKTDLVVAGYCIHNNKVLLIHHKKLNMWLPVGGHIDPNETPDEALIREFKEEVDLDIQILNQSQSPIVGAVLQNCAVPFHVNIHDVGDHNHCCLFYACKPQNNAKVTINAEVNNFKWFTKEELSKHDIPPDVKNEALKVLSEYTG